MARARNLKPSFFTNDRLAELEPVARLLFQGLWCVADREGRLEDRPRKIKAEVLPYDEVDCDALLTKLHGAGFIIRYAAGDKKFIQVKNFTKHQNPHVKEAPSTIPAPDSPGAKLGETGTSRASSLFPLPSSPIPQPESPLPENRNGAHAPVAPAPAVPERDQVFEVFSHWTTTMGHPKAKLDDKRRKAIKAALKLGYTPENLKAAIDGCKLSPFHQGQNDRSEVYDGLHLILRDADHIDKFIRQAGANPNVMQLGPAGRGTVAAGQDWLRDQEGGNAGH